MRFSLPSEPRQSAGKARVIAAMNQALENGWEVVYTQPYVCLRYTETVQDSYSVTGTFYESYDRHMFAHIVPVGKWSYSVAYAYAPWMEATTRTVTQKKLTELLRSADPFGEEV